MPALEVVWPQRDMQALQRQIHRATDVLGKSIDQSLSWAAFYLARSAAKRTATAPKKRRDEVNRNANNRHWPKRRYPYYREVWIDGPKNSKRWYIKEKADTKFKTIKKAGLAKKSWLWMIPMIRAGGGKSFASLVDKRKSGRDVEIEMSNMLPYIMHALKTQEGNYLLNDALGKAASQMEKVIDYKLKRALK